MSTRMLSAGIVSLYHPGSLLFYRHEQLIFARPSAVVQHQQNLKMKFSFPYCRHIISCAATTRNHHQELSSDDGFDQKPFWLTMIEEIAQSLRSLTLFLVEQPSQLKYIEWPSLESTAKTATLTLVLVALLIVALASVDSFLFYILALFVRKVA